MTVPTPAPGPAPGTSGGAQNPSGITLPDAGTTSSASQYGLGTTSDMVVDLAGNQITAEDAMTRLLRQSSPSQIAQIQSYLWKGGFYRQNADPPTLGAWDVADIKALSDAVSTSAQTQVPVLDFIRRQAAYGVYSGVAGAVNGSASKMHASGRLEIQQQDPKRLAQMIDAEFKNLAGRKATAGEKAGFVAAFNAAFRASQTANYEAQYGSLNPGDSGPAPMPPEYLPTAPQPDTTQHGGLFGPLHEGLANVAWYAQNQQFIDANNAGGLFGGIATAAQNVVNSEENARRYQADQQFLQLADLPLGSTPGQGGSAGSSMGSSFTTQAFDPEAFAESYVRQNATGEVGGHDAANTFNMFLNILRGG